MLHNYMFRPFFRPSSGCICLALRVMYPDDKVYYFDDEISIILTLVLLWLVCRQFSMNGHRLRVWDGNDGIMFVSCSSVSIVVSGFSYAAQSLRCLVWGWCVFGYLCRFAPLCEDKKEELCVRYCGCGLMSVYLGVSWRTYMWEHVKSPLFLAVSAGVYKWRTFYWHVCCGSPVVDTARIVQHKKSHSRL